MAMENKLANALQPRLTPPGAKLVERALASASLRQRWDVARPSALGVQEPRNRPTQRVNAWLAAHFHLYVALAVQRLRSPYSLRFCLRPPYSGLRSVDLFWGICLSIPAPLYSPPHRGKKKSDAPSRRLWRSAREAWWAAKDWLPTSVRRMHP